MKVTANDCRKILNERKKAFKISKKHAKSSKCSLGSNSEIYLGNNIEILKSLPSDSLDGCVTDGPYGLKFLSNDWDNQVPSVELWQEVYRVLKPGAFVASFGSPKTAHKMITNIEHAGFEIQGQINWIYASGMPKSKSLPLMIDKQLGNPNRGHRIATASRKHPDGTFEPNGEKLNSYVAISEDAQKWEGYGTAGLKPAFEPISIAQKPISEKNIASNVLKWETGGINIDACRVKGVNENPEILGRFPADIILECICNEMSVEKVKSGKVTHSVLTHSDPDCPCYQLDQQSGLTHQGHWPQTKITGFGTYGNGKSEYLGTGRKDIIKSGASSFFKIIYNPKANRRDKVEGLSNEINAHPTVKPTKLMQELVRLLIPQGGKVLDPFFGSGSTGKACLREGNFDFVGIEISPGYFETSVKRCTHEKEKLQKSVA
jgi:site-specific DNA-methyltransferase (adenine-specific)